MKAPLNISSILNAAGASAVSRERNGVKIDPAVLHANRGKLPIAPGELEQRAHEIAGKRLISPNWLQTILFETGW